VLIVEDNRKIADILPRASNGRASPCSRACRDESETEPVELPRMLANIEAQRGRFRDG
jgi:hypothetical protein